MPKDTPREVYDRVLARKLARPADFPGPDEFATELLKEARNAGLSATRETGETTGLVEGVRLSTGELAYISPVTIGGITRALVSACN
jgi:hypothetical protein